MGTSIKLVDLYPDQAQYRPGRRGSIRVEIFSEIETGIKLHARFYHLHRLAWEESLIMSLPGRETTVLSVPFEAPEKNWGGYGVEITLMAEGHPVDTGSTAFDVADHWRRAPRYGFLSDFDPEEKGKLADVESLNKFHLNVVQFYDWMYRHDRHLPPTEPYIDPMGRTLSYKVVEEKRRAVQDKGMAAMAYGAVYASLKDFLDEHKDWGLYQKNGLPFQLIDTFYIMDISPDSPWTDHIVADFKSIVEAGFDGIHMDQYGFPKKAYRMRDGRKEIVDLADCYGPLIDRTKQAVTEVNREAGLIYNNVSNYPVAKTAAADQDAVYIEVWPPVIHLRELKGLIDRAKELGKKNVILSAYLPAFHPDEGTGAEEAETGALLVMAAIFASGGYHLLLGEDRKVLTAAYYPDYGVMRESFVRRTRRYYDFIVRYAELLYHPELIDLSMTYTGGINSEIAFQGSVPFEPNGNVGEVWTIVKRRDRFDMLHLLNLAGIDNDLWEHGKSTAPLVQRNIECRILAEREPEGVYFASPDRESTAPVQLDFDRIAHEQGEAIRFRIPEVQVWSMVYIEWKL